MIYLTALPATRLLRPSSPPSVCGEPRAIRERVGREVRSSPAVRSKQEPALTRANTREQAKKNRPYRRFFNYPGGEGGIRTRGGILSHTRFPGVRLKPLIHLSKKAHCSRSSGDHQTNRHAPNYSALPELLASNLATRASSASSFSRVRCKTCA